MIIHTHRGTELIYAQLLNDGNEYLRMSFDYKVNNKIFIKRCT